MDVDYASGWQAVFAQNGYHSFADLWRLDAGWFEPRNERRGGWSGVSRIELTLPGGEQVGAFLKRQQNHVRRTWRHPLAGEQTFAIEWRNIGALSRQGVATLEPILFAQRRFRGDWQTILVTRELAGYMSLQELAAQWWSTDLAGSRSTRRALIPAAASLARKLHLGGHVHNCFYPKHLFVNPDTLDVRVIDLEKMRRAGNWKTAALRDLDSLNRHARHWSRSDRLRFLLHYLRKERLDESVAEFWRQLARRAAAKRGQG